MRTEDETRKLIARIDELRADSALCERMASHWMDHNGELVQIETVTLRRRWRSSDKTTHSERVMNAAERDHLRDWLYVRARQQSDAASELARELEGKTDE